MKTKVISTGGGGVTSCLGMRLHDAIQFCNKNGMYPDMIDSSGQFHFYRDTPYQDVSCIILGDYKPDDSIVAEFDPGWQFAWYDEINLPKLSEVANFICNVSPIVGDRSYAMRKIIDGRTAVLYRGNDKGLDYPRTHYQGMVEMALATGSDRFIVQTDENNFYDFFKERFPDTVCFEELPRIDKDPDAYVMPPVGQRVEFCINFLAALRAIASAPKVVLNTGNTGLWVMMYRGDTKNVWQIRGVNQQWRKLKYKK